MLDGNVINQSCMRFSWEEISKYLANKHQCSVNLCIRACSLVAAFVGGGHIYLIMVLSLYPHQPKKRKC